jgi:hypothetical protein
MQTHEMPEKHARLWSLIGPSSIYGTIPGLLVILLKVLEK